MQAGAGRRRFACCGRGVERSRRDPDENRAAFERAGATAKPDHADSGGAAPARSGGESFLMSSVAKVESG